VLDHYRALMEELGADRVFAYLISTHTNNDLDPEDLGTLAAEGLAGFKDSTKSAERHHAYAEAVRGAGREDFTLLSGSGWLLLESLRDGGSGAVLAVTNLHPELCCRLRDAFRAGDDDAADVLQAELTRAEQANTIPELKREVAERMRSELGIDYNPAMQAPFGIAGRPLAQRT